MAFIAENLVQEAGKLVREYLSVGSGGEEHRDKRQGVLSIKYGSYKYSCAYISTHEHLLRLASKEIKYIYCAQFSGAEVLADGGIVYQHGSFPRWFRASTGRLSVVPCVKVYEQGARVGTHRHYT